MKIAPRIFKYVKDKEIHINGEIFAGYFRNPNPSHLPEYLPGAGEDKSNKIANNANNSLINLRNNIKKEIS